MSRLQNWFPMARGTGRLNHSLDADHSTFSDSAFSCSATGPKVPLFVGCPRSESLPPASSFSPQHNKHGTARWPPTPLSHSCAQATFVVGELMAKYTRPSGGGGEEQRHEAGRRHSNERKSLVYSLYNSELFICLQQLQQAGWQANARPPRNPPARPPARPPGPCAHQCQQRP